ncbi:MAG: Lrp/AsnC family transcriptional regulator [Spirochaetaceae bacterium]|nr:Lrp/AsnC family transcriptional regulator [Spirochaetaceae bacterium]
MFRLDRLNMRIIGHLQEGRKSFNKIAVALGVSENTVKARVRKLEEEGILKIAGYVDPEAMEGHQIVYIGVKLKDMNYLAKGEEISQIRRVVSVGVVTGRYDLIVTVHLKSGFGLLEFLSEELGKIERIESVETYLVYKGFHIKVPYIVDEQELKDMDK